MNAGADDATYEIAFRFQDGEVFTHEQLAKGLGLFDEEVPAIVGRQVGDDEWVELGYEFRAEYDPHFDDEGDPS